MDRSSYWTTKSADAFDATATELQGFEVGQEEVKLVLRPTQVEQKVADWNPTVKQPVTCIGCHTSTPDGLYAGFTGQPPWGNVIAGIKPEILGKSPPFLTPAGLEALTQRQLGVMTFSGAHWRDGDHLALVPWGDDVDEGVRPTKLAWLDLEAKESGEGKAWGFLSRAGDLRSAGAPRWSHNGQLIVYTSTKIETTGRIGGSKAAKPPAPAQPPAGDGSVRRAVQRPQGRRRDGGHGRGRSGGERVLSGSRRPTIDSCRSTASPPAPSLRQPEHRGLDRAGLRRRRDPRCVWPPTIRRVHRQAEPGRHQQLGEVGARQRRREGGSATTG